MNRDHFLHQLTKVTKPWDLIVIGGGATGAGVAVDAASRGFSALLLERLDFGSGTSSRSTKLIHGGVRYLRQGHIPLVFEALHERSRLRRNAPHLVHDLPFVIPSYRWWETPYYGLGLSIYDLLAGGDQFPPARMLSRRETIRRVPTIRTSQLKGGVVYHDGQFDDSRLLIELIKMAHQLGAVTLNYAPVIGLSTNSAGRVVGVHFKEEESGQTYEAPAKLVINATGVFVDGVRRLAERESRPMVAPSQGTHLVFDKRFLPGDSALMVPETPDGRVMFAIPWLGHTLVGTTDVAVPSAEVEPHATNQEVDFILSTASQYLNPAPTRADVLSIFTGIRPLVQDMGKSSTATLSREHVILEEPKGLLTVTGGKWTTFRRMAEQVVDHAITSAQLPGRKCRTKNMGIGRAEAAMESNRLHPDFTLTREDVTRFVRYEMARKVEDVLARRSRILFLNARAAIDLAPQVASIMADELKLDREWQARQIDSFAELAKNYFLGST